MASLAQPSDVAAGWRPLTAEETGVAVTLLTRASALIRLLPYDVETRMGTDPDYAVTVRGACADMVKRVLMNPEAWRTESIDDFTGTRDVTVASGMLYVSDLELSQLVPSAGSMSSAYVVSLWG